MIRSLAVFCLVTATSTLFSQEVGTQKAYKILAKQQQAANDAAMAWTAARKLSSKAIPPNLKAPSSPDLELERLEVGTKGSMAYWNFKVGSIVDETNCILNVGSKRSIWLEGFPTTGMVSDEALRLIDPVIVTGTKAYITVGGASRTLYSIRMITGAELEKYLEEKRLLQFTRFHSKAGTQVLAKFVKYSGGKVHLKTSDGRAISVALSAFTKESADLLRAKIREVKDSH